MAEADISGWTTRSAHLLGIPVVVTGEHEWELVFDGTGGFTVRIGTGWYDRHGLSASDSDALIAQIMLDLWASVRFATGYPERAQRRRALALERPELEPMLVAADQLQAAAELLAAFPGLYAGLARATARRIPDELRRLTWEHQFVAAVVRLALTGNEEMVVRVDEPVADELSRIDAKTLRVAATPDAEASVATGGMRPFERLLGLILPPVERLIAAQAANRGLTDQAVTTGAQGDDAHDQDPGQAVDFGSDTVEADSTKTATSAEQERARQADSRDTAEGADLFEAQQAADISAMLQTPLPVTSTWLTELMHTVDPVPATPSTPEAQHVAGGAAGATPATLNLARYRTRLESFTPAIERMREVWREVIHERIGSRRAPSRFALEAGDALHRASLPRVLAEVQAGVARPRAYTRTEHHPRETEGTGHTDYVLAIDRSGSMRVAAQATADAVLVMIEALAGVAREIEEAERATGRDAHLEIRTSLIVFDSEAVVVKPLARAMGDDTRAQFYNEVLATRGGTDDARALRLAARELGLADAPGQSVTPGEPRKRVVIVLSDGESNDPAAAAREIETLRARGVRVYGVGVASDETVHRFAPDGTRVDDPSDIARVLGRLMRHDETR